MKKLALIILGASIFSFAVPKANAQISVGVGVSVRLAPPVIPVYVQPECPTDGYLWQPGYWAYGDDGYYWVPGVWVAPPNPGLLWTPGYWGYGDGGVYLFHSGYWGPHVGFYGGINYGFGYYGSGFGGGVWVGNRFRYNTAVFRVNSRIVHNTYVNRTVINNVNNRTSFNGGPRGTHAAPNSQERSYMNERHVQPTRQQMTHQQSAAHDRNQFASVNHGAPHNAAVSRPITSQRSFAPRTQGNAPAGRQGFGGNHQAAVQQAGRQGFGDNHQPAANRPAPQPSHQGFGGGNHQAAASKPAPQMSRPAPQQMSRPAPQQHGGGGGGRPMGGGGHPGGGGGRHH